MPKQDDTQRSLGRIEGHLKSILQQLDRGDKRMENHGRRIRRVENRQTGLWIGGGVLTGVIIFADKIKTLFGN